jgi:hypothetical protein
MRWALYSENQDSRRSKGAARGQASLFDTIINPQLPFITIAPPSMICAPQTCHAPRAHLSMQAGCGGA